MSQIIECKNNYCENFEDGKCTLDKIRIVLTDKGLRCEDADERIITEVKFNDEPPTEFNYKHFNVVLEDGQIKTFHYHINNPIPTEEEILGLTWERLCNLCLEKFHEAIKR